MEDKIKNFLLDLTNNIIYKKIKTIDIINFLLTKINLNIEQDIVLNDLRTIYFKKIDELSYNKDDESFYIVIESTIIIDKHDNKKKDYVKIFYKEKVYKYYLNY